MKICVFGDSITHGFSDFEQGGWVERLKKYLEEKDDETRVYNQGISGDDSRGVLERLENESRLRKAEMIIIAIGINDSKFLKSKNANEISMDEFRSNIERIITIGKKITDKIIMIGLTPVDDRLTDPTEWNENISYSNESVKKYDEAVKKISAENDVVYTPMFDAINLDDLDDGLHPNSEGHRKMFERIHPEVDMLL